MDAAGTPLGRHGERERITLNVIAGLLLATGLSVAAGWALSVQAARNGVARQTQILVAAEQLQSALKDVETGERGYALTGEDSYLEPYEAANRALPALVAGVESGEIGVTLIQQIQLKQDFARRVIEARRSGGLDPAVALVRTGVDKASMDAVRLTVSRLQQNAGARIARSDQKQAARGFWLALLASASTLGAFAVMAVQLVRRRRAERTSAALLGSVMDNAPIGLGFLDPQLRVQHMNQALVAMSDRALDAEIGRSLWDILPQQRETLEPRLQHVLSGGGSVTTIGVTVEHRAHAGQQRHFELGFFPLPGLAGQSAGAGLVIADVTHRARAERRLRESEARFRTLIETTASIVWTMSSTGELIPPQTSWTAFTGQGPAEYAARGWMNAVHPEDRAETLETWERAVLGHTPYFMEHRLRRADGAWRIMAMRAVPILDDGMVREWSGSHTDITERKTAEADLSAARDAAEAANHAKSQFLANMSHELRTPLSAVIGYSEMLEEEVQDSGDHHLLADIQKIQSNARHLLSLINDVLDLSKIEADRMTSFAETFAVDALVRDAAATVDGLVTQKGNTLVIELGPDVGEMHTDLVKLRQCLFNLVSNAAKFTENGQITLRAARDGGTMRFSVADTGIGMTPGQLDRLFERFSQADISTTRRFGGTGLGLAITRAFCRLLGGDVTVTSVAGQGSVFTIALPVTMPEQAPEPDESAPPDAPGRHVVLVVDDDAGQRELLSRFLEREGFAVRTAPDGKTCLELAREVHPHAILLDVMMPQMDGWSVLSALKSEQGLARIPVVMVTFVNEPGLSASLGASDTVLKPVEWDRLRTVMERFRGEAGDILVVDDDPDARRRLRIVLERDGWSVSEAENGAAALSAVERALPQLILLDLTMPVMDGFAFLHELRARPQYDNVPVVVLTARDLDAGERRQLDGADRVLSKGDTDLRQLSGELRRMTPTHAPIGQS